MYSALHTTRMIFYMCMAGKSDIFLHDSTFTEANGMFCVIDVFSPTPVKLAYIIKRA